MEEEEKLIKVFVIGIPHRVLRGDVEYLSALVPSDVIFSSVLNDLFSVSTLYPYDFLFCFPRAYIS